MGTLRSIPNFQKIVLIFKTVYFEKTVNNFVVIVYYVIIIIIILGISKSPGLS